MRRSSSAERIRSASTAVLPGGWPALHQRDAACRRHVWAPALSICPLCAVRPVWWLLYGHRASHEPVEGPGSSTSARCENWAR
jgi:hypothetical protein